MESWFFFKLATKQITLDQITKLLDFYCLKTKQLPRNKTKPYIFKFSV